MSPYGDTCRRCGDLLVEYIDDETGAVVVRCETCGMRSVVPPIAV